MLKHKSMAISRSYLIDELKKSISNGKLIEGEIVKKETKIKDVEENNVNFFFIYNSNIYSHYLESFLPYGNANEIVFEAGSEIIPYIKKKPVIAGVCATDPFKLMNLYLKQIKKVGFSGVQNFPTIGLIDGTLREHLNDMNLNYNQEVNMILEARNLGLFTCPFVFQSKDARKMAEVGADCLIAHLGVFTKNMLMEKEEKLLSEHVKIIQEIINEGKKINPDIFILFYCELPANSSYIKKIFSKTTGLDGYILYQQNSFNS